MLLNSGRHGIIYIATFSVTNIAFVVSIQNTNVANTLVMIAMAPMLSAVLGAIFLKKCQIIKLGLQLELLLCQLSIFSTTQFN